MIYVFGYGSLIAADGINGRGMKRIYQESDIFETVLKGYQRAYCAEVWGKIFLGIFKNKNAYVNGVLFPIAPEDLKAFKMSEGGNAAYDYVDVTNQIGDMPDDCKLVLTCVSHTPYFSLNAKVPGYYIELVADYLSKRSKSFQRAFYTNPLPAVGIDYSFPNFYFYKIKRYLRGFLIKVFK